MEKHSLPVLVAVLMAFPVPARAQHQRTFETCRSYRHTETYVPGRINANGRYEQGEVRNIGTTNTLKNWFRASLN